MLMRGLRDGPRAESDAEEKLHGSLPIHALAYRGRGLPELERICFSIRSNHHWYIWPRVFRAKIKAIEITEVPDLNPQACKPDDPEDFCCTFGLTIGPADAGGGELFYLTVCTPAWLAKACARDGFVLGRYHLIVPRYDLEAITRTLTKFIENCSGAWNDLALRLSRIASWEFEDYGT
jgi:hypothetical protein